ncbi:hypothetical protein [Mucilaginibacter sp. FT3.2]|uniref:hypothetical protein n=1 Tax=Mucilaginibacter sp. FT3.2 TaxID=2723090 RepID=UPI001615530B|nr:hypothetical protein [Mucilaginibacter sp. FT3.2]MBB6233748.1 uncharacterized protein (DUF983 family) [Mucilaginibacter sp. FT3.2]
MKALAKQLFKTFLFSVILSIAVNSVYYAVTQKGIDYSHALPAIFEGIVFLNIIVFIMTLPTLFLANPLYWNNLVVRLPLYFSGSIAFLVTALTMQLTPSDRVVYLVTGCVFIIVHSVFYYLRVKGQARA